MFAAKNELFTRPSAGGYTISRSVRLRSSASAYFNRTPAGAGNRTTWTWSGWIKLGQLATGTNQAFFAAGDGTTGNYLQAFFDGTTQALSLTALNSSSVVMQKISSSVYRDPSAWYHIVFAYDSTQATSTNRIKIYVNGVQLTSFSTNTDPALNTQTLVNSTNQHTLSSLNYSSRINYFDGYLAEINFIDGQALTPTSFGQFNSVTGVWQPLKYTGTYGTNGFYLNFSDNSNNTATTIGKDYSGNGNNWTPNNISVTSGTTYDSMLDVPTLYADGGNGRGNYAVLSPLDITNTTKPTDGNLNYSPSGVSPQVSFSSIAIPSSGKWYAEFTKGDTSGNWPVGIQGPTRSGITYASQTEGIAYWAGGQIYKDSVLNQSSLATATTGDVIGVAVDAGAQTVQFYKNGATVGTAVSYTYSQVWFACGNYVSGLVFNANFGQRPFAYTPPSGFVALNTQNLPAPTISNGALYMAATTYTGNGTYPTTITNGGNNTIGTTFQPDLVWMKARSIAYDNVLYDSVRGTGTGASLVSNNTAAEGASAVNSNMSAFASNGFTIGSTSSTNILNANGQTFVAWQWQAGQGTTSSNTNGNRTSTVSVNATAGFSVVTYTFSTSATNTVGHGLGVAPAFIIMKDRTTAYNWDVYHQSVGYTQRLILNSTAAAGAGFWSAAPTSTVFSVTTSAYTNNDNIVAYCFSAVAGYSAFGSYTGNGSTDGPFVFTNFRPRWIMVKRTDAATYNWILWDSSRNTYNVTDLYLNPNISSAEATGVQIDILSNGFKCRATDANINASGGTYIYAAFSEVGFKYALGR